MPRHSDGAVFGPAPVSVSAVEVLERRDPSPDGLIRQLDATAAALAFGDGELVVQVDQVLLDGCLCDE